MRYAKILALAFAAAVSATPALAAVPLSLAKFSGGTAYNSFNSFGANSTFHSDIYGTSSASVSATNGLEAHVFGNTTALLGPAQGADAHISFLFAVLSAAPGNAQIIINAATTAAGSGTFFADAEVGLFSPTLTKTIARSHSCGGGGCSKSSIIPSNGGPVSVSILTNQTYRLSLNVNGGTGDILSSFDAFADPTFSFDPNFEAPAGARFQFSENLRPELLGVAGAVPEPATWAMMIGGFGLAGAALRRRRSLAMA